MKFFLATIMQFVSGAISPVNSLLQPVLIQVTHKSCLTGNVEEEIGLLRIKKSNVGGWFMNSLFVSNFSRKWFHIRSNRMTETH